MDHGSNVSLSKKKGGRIQAIRNEREVPKIFSHLALCLRVGKVFIRFKSSGSPNSKIKMNLFTITLKLNNITWADHLPG